MKKRIKWKKIYYTIIVMCFFVLFTVHMIMLFNKENEQLDRMDKKITQTEGEIDKIRDKNARIRTKIELLEKGPYIEKIAREKLGMVKEDEVALVKLNKNEEKKEFHENYGEKEEKDGKKSSGTVELFKKNVEDFFHTLFGTISIKER